MLKSFTFSLLSFMLVISILAPSIEVLCKVDQESIIVMDFNEEEKKNNKEEKKFDQKKLFFNNSTENKSLYLGQKITRSQPCLLTYSDFSSEIILPPPEHLI